MNTALILAGGIDPRFQMNIPKQFVNVNNRPIIVYTLEIFQNHPDIDEIIVTCVDGWQEMVRVYGNQFNITKLKEIIPGGKDAQESTYRGLKLLRDRMGKGDMVVIHDAIRPIRFSTSKFLPSFPVLTPRFSTPATPTQIPKSGQRRPKTSLPASSRISRNTKTTQPARLSLPPALSSKLIAPA